MCTISIDIAWVMRKIFHLHHLLSSLAVRFWPILYTDTPFSNFRLTKPVLLISQGRILEKLPTSFLQNYAFLIISMLLLCIQFCFDLMILIMLREDYKLWSFSLCNILDSSIIALVRLTSNALNVCFFLGTRHQVSHPYHTIEKHSLNKSTPKTMANSLTCG
jgi:hypothetical protein